MQTTALSIHDCDTLMEIYKVRLNFFIKSCVGIMALALYSSFAGYKYSLKHSNLSNFEAFILCSIVELILIIALAVIYKKRIKSLKRDVKNGVKEVICYKITQKQHFKNTNQFFIGLDNPNYLHYELDYETWNKLIVGDYFEIYRAPFSKYVFNTEGKYTFI